MKKLSALISKGSDVSITRIQQFLIKNRFLGVSFRRYLLFRDANGPIRHRIYESSYFKSGFPGPSFDPGARSAEGPV